MTKSIPNYVCIMCGRGFTTKRSGIRHINTVESGYGYIVTEADYRVGILKGTIPPPLPKRLLPPTKSRFSSTTTFDVYKDELVKGFFRRLGEIICEKLESEHRIDHGTIGAIIMSYMTEAARSASKSSRPS
jgi:hypothetical protein